MARERHPLTAQVQATVCAYVRAGCFLEVAAGAAGVPRVVFRGWMWRGTRRQAGAACRRFVEAVRQAQAHARLRAETAMLADRPLDWLRYGPGKPAAGRPGWTGLAKAPEPRGRAGGAAFMRGVAGIIAGLLDVLAPFPEARAAAGRWAGGLTGPTRGGAVPGRPSRGEPRA